jgi:predicted metal-dependent HD superfamily phosphohydrolase
MADQALLDDLWVQWQGSLQSFALPPNAMQTSFQQIVASYSSSGCYYHTLEHVHHVLKTIQALKQVEFQPDVVQLAAWLHDVVYDSRANDNEQQSAEYAKNLLKDLHIPFSVIDPVQRLILATKHDVSTFQDWDTQVLIDADLAILGTNPETYQRYAIAIRQEYNWVTDEDYCAGRQRVLTSFLRRDRIFHTPLLLRQAEQQARCNLQTELQRLQDMAP